MQDAGASIIGVGSALTGMTTDEIKDYFVELSAETETPSGRAEAKIHYELFGASAADAAVTIERHHERARKFGGQRCEVIVKVDGHETTLELTPDGENILDAALEAGVDLPFACKGGACATCKARLAEGEVEMDVHHALEAHEIDEGMVLTCQAHPVSKKVVIDFDRSV